MLDKDEIERTSEIGSFDGEFAFLSNFLLFPIRPPWWPATLPAFPSLEHAFAAWKVSESLAFTVRLDWIERIRSADTAGKAKRLGRNVPLRTDWDDLRVPVMERLLSLKFSHGPLAAMLLGTDKRKLVEGNHWHDQFWGDCTCGREACSEPGANMLGQLLMSQRARLRRELGGDIAPS